MKSFLILTFAALASVAAQGQVCLSAEKQHVFGKQHTDIAVGNFNPNVDNLPDLVTVDYNFMTGQVQLMKRNGTDGNGQPTFSLSVVDVFTYPTRLFVADFDGVNGDDVAVISDMNHQLAVLLNDGNGNLSATTYAVGLQPKGITGGHFDNDGFIDLAVANYAGRTVTILHGDGAGNFINPQTVSLQYGGQEYQPYDVIAGDFDGNGRTDLAVTLLGGADAYYAYLSRDAAGVYTMRQPQQIGTQGIMSAHMDTADFDLDGLPDIVIACQSQQPTRNLGIIKSRPGLLPSPVPTVPLPWDTYGVSCADYNGDGKPDIALTHKGGADSLKIMLGSGDHERFLAQRTINLAPVGGALLGGLANADFNGDGKPDFIVAYNGLNNLAPTVSTILNTTPYFDFTGDTVLCAAGTASLAVWGNPGLTYAWDAGVATGAGNTFSFTASNPVNFYSVRGNGVAGCYNLSFGVVRVRPANITVTNNPDTVLTAHGSNTAFQWLHCTAQGDTIIPGATGQSFTPDSSGSFRVVVTNAYGCTDTSACRSVIIPQNPNNPGNPGVGLDDAQAAKALRIYPNPASGVFTVEYPGGVQAVAVLDLTGRVVQRIGGNGAQALTVNFDAPAGVYILRIETPDGTYTQRLLSK